MWLVIIFFDHLAIVTFGIVYTIEIAPSISSGDLISHHSMISTIDLSSSLLSSHLLTPSPSSTLVLTETSIYTSTITVYATPGVCTCCKLAINNILVEIISYIDISTSSSEMVTSSLSPLSSSPPFISPQSSSSHRNNLQTGVFT